MSATSLCRIAGGRAKERSRANRSPAARRTERPLTLSALGAAEGQRLSALGHREELLHTRLVWLEADAPKSSGGRRAGSAEARP